MSIRKTIIAVLGGLVGVTMIGAAAAPANASVNHKMVPAGCQAVADFYNGAGPGFAFDASPGGGAMYLLHDGANANDFYACAYGNGGDYFIQEYGTNWCMTADKVDGIIVSAVCNDRPAQLWFPLAVDGVNYYFQWENYYTQTCLWGPSSNDNPPASDLGLYACGANIHKDWEFRDS